jgi:hypothetical protein
MKRRQFLTMVSSRSGSPTGEENGIYDPRSRERMELKTSYPNE